MRKKGKLSAIAVTAVLLTQPSVAKEQPTQQAGTPGAFAVKFFKSGNAFELTNPLSSMLLATDNDSAGVAIDAWFPSSGHGQWGISYQNEIFDQGIYDNTSDSLHLLSLGYRHHLFAENKLSSFVHGGVGYGYMTVNEDIWLDDSARALSAKFGTGLAYDINEAFTATLGFDVQYRIWSSFIYDSREVSVEDTSTVWSLGLEYKF